MSLAITAIFAGLNALILFWLAIETIKRRRGERISIMDGGDTRLAALMRAHANAAEFIPIFLICLGTVESLGAPWFVLLPLGAAFTLGRALHAVHFVQNRPGFAWRIAGMHLTLWPLLLIALGAIAHGVTAAF